MQKRWILKPAATAEHVAELAGQLNILPLTAQILIHRGLTDLESATQFLNPTGIRLINFRELPGTQEAGALMAQAIRERAGIAIFGDYDVDGVTSTAVMAEFIRDRGGKVQILLPDRLSDGYGLNIKCLDALKEQNVQYLITVDCGITALAEVRRARELGLNVIVTDHHEPGAELPEAHAIVNPKVSGPETFRTLAGVGVALQVIRAAAEALGETDHEPLRKYLDLVALGTVADVVPLLGENRRLTRAGLSVINRGNRPGLTALIKAAALEKGALTSQDLAFKLAPRLNAAGRIGDAQQSYDLLMADSESTADALAQQLNQLNTRRQSMEQAVIAEATQHIQALDPLPWALMVAGRDWPLGVLGLAASKLCERFHRPCFVLGEHEGFWRGSGRSIPGFPLHAVLDSLAPILHKWGGHEMAAGVTLVEEHLDAFRQGLDASAHVRLTEEMMTPFITVDACVGLKELTPRFCQELKALEPYGFCNTRPMLKLSQMWLATAPRVVGERHLKLKLTDGQNRSLDAIGFGLAEEAQYLDIANPLDIVGHLMENTWNGTTSLQLEIKDIHR